MRMVSTFTPLYSCSLLCHGIKSKREKKAQWNVELCPSGNNFRVSLLVMLKNKYHVWPFISSIISPISSFPELDICCWCCGAWRPAGAEVGDKPPPWLVGTLWPQGPERQGRWVGLGPEAVLVRGGLQGTDVHLVVECVAWGKGERKANTKKKGQEHVASRSWTARFLWRRSSVFGLFLKPFLVFKPQREHPYHSIKRTLAFFQPNEKIVSKAQWKDGWWLWL